jgi:hypothetical protein
MGHFLFATTSRSYLGPTQPPINWVPWILSSGVRRSGREADHSLPSTAHIKNEWGYTFTSPYVFMAWWLVQQGYVFMTLYFVKYMDKFTFIFTHKPLSCKLTCDLAKCHVCNCSHYLITCMSLHTRIVSKVQKHTETRTLV